MGQGSLIPYKEPGSLEKGARVILPCLFSLMGFCLTWLLNPFISRLCLALQALYIAVGMVILLTWVVMPVLVRILRPWLEKNAKGREEYASTQFDST